MRFETFSCYYNYGARGVRREVEFSQYIEVTAPLVAVKKSLRCICVRWPSSSKVDQGVHVKELKNVVVKAYEWYGLERLSSLFGSVHLREIKFQFQLYFSLLQNWHGPPISSMWISSMFMTQLRVTLKLLIGVNRLRKETNYGAETCLLWSKVAKVQGVYESEFNW